MKNKKQLFNWSELPDGAKEVLGSQFWEDIRQLIPAKGPAINILDRNTECIIFAEFPGLASLEKIHLKQKGTDLILEGTVNDRHHGEKFILKERFTGSFQRQIPIPFHFTQADVTASFQHGLLEIKIKKHMTDKEIHLPISE